MRLVKFVLLLAGLVGSNACRLTDAPDGPALPIRLLAPYVGQGHGIAIIQGNLAVVFDAGPPEQDGLWRALDDAGVDTIAALFLTHPDLDHWGGLDSLLVHLPLRRLIHGPVDPNRLKQTFGWACRQIPSGCETTAKGRSLPVLDGVKVDVLWPDSGAVFDEPNNGSLVLRTRRGNHGLLLVSGDLDTTGELQIASRLLPTEVVQLGHHGSRSSGHLRFLGSASPKWIVVQAGIDNDYGHPHAEALARARAVGTEIVRPLPGKPFRFEM
jgi:competence protein ComEC